ncbi:jumonji domain-containing protein 1 [Exophiala viscosa]|uniref:jumonji domain-containing protein 1 n=1 Tax=Exophiala viscosa TaxID=2486360 RepID=UPI00218EB329|nr:jumonji domain-containing protein 1 [Exophiala viscosa]
MFGIIADLIASATTFLLPAYLSYKALRTNDPAQTHPWLIYFTILTLTLLFESWTIFIIGWIPFYSWLRLIFLLYLVLPQTQGAKLLYLEYLEPYIVDHESRIDQFIGETHARLQQMGLGYMNILIEFLRDKILGQKSPQPEHSQSQSTAGAGTAIYASYASDLLSRFAMPGARTDQPNPQGTTSASVYSAISNLAGAAFAGSSAAGAPRSAAHEASSIPGSLVDTIPGSTSSEKANYISAQRERLSTLLKALDREQQSLDLAYGSAPTYNRPPSSSSGASGLKTKSRSEVSFENVDYDEATERVHTPGSTPPRLATEPPQARRTTSGNWLPAGMGGWFGGGSSTTPHNDRTERDRGDTDEQSSTASKGWSAARDITEEMARGMSSGVDTGR